LSSGSHTFVIDVSGPGGSDSASSTWTVFVVQVSVNITSAPSNSSSTSVVITYTATNATAVTCTLDNAPVECTSTVADLSDLAVGKHTFSVSATAPSGDKSASITWTVLAKAPAVTIKHRPRNSSARALIIHYAVSGKVTGVTCTLNNKRVKCTDNSYKVKNLAVGVHTFVVTVKGAGGKARATVTWKTLATHPKKKKFKKKAKH
jgi:Cu/Zn superoxide dismutase